LCCPWCFLWRSSHKCQATWLRSRAQHLQKWTIFMLGSGLILWWTPKSSPPIWLWFRYTQTYFAGRVWYDCFSQFLDCRTEQAISKTQVKTYESWTISALVWVWSFYFCFLFKLDLFKFLT
jgi:hypothetical protein